MAAAALAGGDLLGLWTVGAETAAGPTSQAAAIAGAVLALVCILITVRASWGSPPSATPAIVLIAISGFVVGRTAGATATGSCLARLRGGEDVAARGMLLDPVPAARAGERRRATAVRIGSPLLTHRGRRCTAPRLRARVWPGEIAVPAGASVALAGAWRPYPRFGSLPAPPDRSGHIQGRLLAMESAGGAVEGGAASARLTRLGARVRERAARRLDGFLAPDVAATGRALVLADRATLDPAVRRRFTDAGIGHLLAISGLHIGALAGGALWGVGLWIRDRRRYPIVALATGLYVLLIGAPPSAVRAFLLFAGYAATRLRRAPARLGDLAGLAAVIALLADPLVLLDPSFQLSFAGFTGIVAGRAGARVLLRGIGARVHHPGSRRWLSMVTAFVSSAAAFLFTAPFAAAHFGRIVPAAIFSSLLGSSLVALALPALILTLVLPGWLASWSGAAATTALRLLDELAAGFAALPLHWDTAPLGAAGWLALCAIAASIGFLHARRRIAAIVVASSACIGWLVAPDLLRWRDRGRSLVCSLDVGQGDAAAVRTRRGRWILIDSGPGFGFLQGGSSSRPPLRRDSRYGDAGRTTIVPFLRARGVREIELMVLTHPHVDHFGGSAAVFDAFRVRHILDPGFAEPSPAYLGFLDRVDEEGAIWHRARAGFRARVDDIDLLVLWPSEGEVVGGANEHSAVLRVRAPGLDYLNTGDAPATVEGALLAAWPPDSLSAHILKLGHHGSRTSTSLPWLETIRPAIAVISAGRANTHGHPHPSTLARLDSARVPSVWRTDERGSLCVEAGVEGIARFEGTIG